MNQSKYAYKIHLAYDGTHYCGWQIQPNGLTIQKILQEKLHVILKKETTITGASRTDSGVHALGQVAHFHHCEEIDLFRFLASINGVLPKTIRVKKVEPATIDFHARYDAKRKIYLYHIHLDYIQNPFTDRYRWHIPQKLNLALLQEAAKCFVGTHDFTSFANENFAGAAAKNPVRTLKRLDMIPEEEGIRLEFEAQGFLYKMVRNITGTLVEIAKGKRTIDEIPKIFSARDRRKAGMTAPPLGLFLVQVDYENS